jgi:hypothetical protein
VSVVSVCVVHLVWCLHNQHAASCCRKVMADALGCWACTGDVGPLWHSLTPSRVCWGLGSLYTVIAKWSTLSCWCADGVLFKAVFTCLSADLMLEPPVRDMLHHHVCMWVHAGNAAGNGDGTCSSQHTCAGHSSA